MDNTEQKKIHQTRKLKNRCKLIKYQKFQHQKCGKEMSKGNSCMLRTGTKEESKLPHKTENKANSLLWK